MALFAVAAKTQEETQLELEVAQYRAATFADSTKSTYRAQFKVYMVNSHENTTFAFVPCTSLNTLGRYSIWTWLNGAHRELSRDIQFCISSPKTGDFVAKKLIIWKGFLNEISKIFLLGSCKLKIYS